MNEQTTAQREFLIPSLNLGRLEARILELNKKCKKLKLEPIVLAHIGHERRVDEKTGDVMIYHRVSVTGQRPIVNGWEYIATLEHTDEGNIIRTVPGTDVEDGFLADFQKKDKWCDHCRTNRRRNDTYLLREISTKAVKQVGRNCLSDFTGHANPLALAQAAEFLALACESAEACRDLLEGFGCGTTDRGAFDLEYFLSWVHSCIRRSGWVSRSSIEAHYGVGEATADQARRLIKDYRKDPDAAAIKEMIPTDADRTRVTAALAWIREGEGIDTSVDFLNNLSVVCKGDLLSHRHIGIAAALFIAFDRAEGDRRARERHAAQGAASQWQGKEGERLTITVTCESAYHHKSDDWRIGIIHIYTLIDNEGNQYKWFSSRDCLDEGTIYQLSATVKKHDAWKGIKQTIVTRCSIKAPRQPKQPKPEPEPVFDIDW
jgi:hypothetical protein